MSAAFYQDEVKFYVAVDCIILGFNNKELNVLLYKRSFEPMKGQWSLMGGFVKSGESVDVPLFPNLGFPLLRVSVGRDYLHKNIYENFMGKDKCFSF